MTALYASADLLQRVKDYLRRPATDAALTDATIYRFLGEAQQEVIEELVVHIPWAMVGAPTLMTTADSGATYTFATDSDAVAVQPIGYVEIFATNPNGRLLYADTYTRIAGGDFVIEGDHIRIPRGQTKTFTSGPYWRGVLPGDLLDGTHEPTLKPKTARPLLVYRACEKLQNIGALKDPTPFAEMYAQKFTAVLKAEKTAYAQAAQVGSAFLGRHWWRQWSANAFVVSGT